MNFKKNIGLVIFVNIILLLSITKVIAQGDVSCTYENINDSSDTVTTVIYFSTDDWGHTVSFKNRSYIYGNNNFEHLSWSYSDWFSDGSETAREYYEKNKKCPDFLYTASTSANKWGIYFSDKVKTYRDAEYKLTDDSSVIQTPDGEFEPTSEKYTCELKTESNDTMLVTVNYTDKTITFGEKIFYSDYKDDYISNYDYTTKNVCPTDLLLCSNNKVGSKVIMSEKMHDEGYSCKKFVPTDKSFEQGTNACSAYIKLRDTYFSEYENKNFTKSNQALDRLKSFCKTITQNSNYDDNEFTCINLCLNINKDIKSTDLNPTGECGFSENLIGFILNIIKWIKYIIPAVVIILSIIDFIKAMAGDKDDEMKKAQGKFIKRLIAAALIFIVPLILEFILDKMGFAEHIKGCGIINF